MQIRAAMGRKSMMNGHTQIGNASGGGVGGHLKFYLDEECDLHESDEMTMLENQVAGHFTGDKENIGMLKCRGTVLKPITKKSNGYRETCFYKNLSTTTDSTLLELKKFVPMYYGNQTIQVSDRDIECIVLQDLTKGYKEPCIMDVKIGRRTWDPDAAYDKILSENEKYLETKRDFGFCIPGFQVYKISNGKLRKYGKDYGKKLNKENLIDAFKTFLNADAVICRSLIVQLLVNLWQILDWSRKQRSLRLYSTSLLLIYDAKRLKQTVSGRLEASSTSAATAPRVPTLTRSASLYRPMSLAVLHDKESVRTGFSGQLNHDGPILRTPVSPLRAAAASTLNHPSHHQNNTNHMRRSANTAPNLRRIHSFQNNYDKDLRDIKNAYADLLGDLVWDDGGMDDGADLGTGGGGRQLWATAKMIDFAHVWPMERDCRGETDENYRDGIQSLVKILEGFLEVAD